jgi:hypothetical protein
MYAVYLLLNQLYDPGWVLGCSTIFFQETVYLSFVNLYRETGLKFLGDVASKQVFKPWEISDNIPRLKYELSTLSPFAQLVDLLHTAAYRRGLGNSLFCPDHLVGSHNTESVSK